MTDLIDVVAAHVQEHGVPTQDELQDHLVQLANITPQLATTLISGGRVGTIPMGNADAIVRWRDRMKRKLRDRFCEGTSLTQPMSESPYEYAAVAVAARELAVRHMTDLLNLQSMADQAARNLSLDGGPYLNGWNPRYAVRPACFVFVPVVNSIASYPAVAIDEGEGSEFVVEVLSPVSRSENGSRYQRISGLRVNHANGSPLPDILGQNLSGMNLRIPLDWQENALQQYEALQQLGWRCQMRITLTGYGEAQAVYRDIPYLMLPPEDHPLYGKLMVLLIDTSYRAETFCNIVYYAQRMFLHPKPDVDADPVDVERAIGMLGTLRQLSSAHQGVMRTLETRLRQQEEREQEIAQTRQTLQTLQRAIVTDETEISVLRHSSTLAAIDTVRSTGRMGEEIAQMRPVASTNMTAARDGLVIEVITNPYWMRARSWCHDCASTTCAHTDELMLKIPPLDIKLNTACSYFEDGIEITGADSGTWVHPHLEPTGGGHSRACWGAASVPLADAWGRRDWTSVLRVVFGWITQYNHRSPYINMHELADYLESDSSAQPGWIGVAPVMAVPDEDTAADDAADQELVSA